MMRWRALAAACVLALNVSAGEAPKVAATQPDPDAKLPVDHNYVVHEWGTFTSFSGSDGISLDFRPLVDEDLPQWVMDRPKQAYLDERREFNWKRGITDKGLVISRQRMETPVTYFYTDSERIVDAWVEFPKGLLTEFFPPPRQYGPAYKKGRPEEIEHSWLRWGKVRLLPQAQAMNWMGRDPYFYDVKAGEGEHYAYARETDSAHIRMVDAMKGTIYGEKFLFYRGVGNFDQPVSMSAGGTDRFLIKNDGKTPLGFAFLVHIEGDAIRFAKVTGVEGTKEVTLPSEAVKMADLSKAMVDALVAEGLFEKEAKAMVKTWKASWFGEDGTRLLYSLPQNYTDALLPLHLEPSPKECKRVMIGRLETLTVEQEKKLEGLIGKLGAADPGVRAQTAEEIRKLGRFAEPALNRVAKVSEDLEVKVQAKALVAKILKESERSLQSVEK